MRLGGRYVVHQRCIFGCVLIAVIQGQGTCKRSSMSETIGSHFQEATVLLGDGLGDEEAKATPLFRLQFTDIELYSFLTYTMLLLWRHAGPSVNDLQQDRTVPL